MSFYVVIDPRNNKQMFIESVSDHDNRILGKSSSKLYIEIEKCNPEIDVFDYVDGKLKKRTKKAVEDEQKTELLDAKKQELSDFCTNFIYSKYSDIKQRNIDRVALPLVKVETDRLTDKEAQCLALHTTMSNKIDEIRDKYRLLKKSLNDMTLSDLKAFNVSADEHWEEFNHVDAI